MMIITGKNNHSGSWHVGETMYVPDGPVLTFQVDGHEASWLLDAITNHLALTGYRMEYPADRLTPIL